MTELHVMCCPQGEERPYMSWAMEMVTGIMQDRIRVSPRDAFGIIFYNTVSKPWARMASAVCMRAPCCSFASPWSAAIQMQLGSETGSLGLQSSLSIA